MNEENVIEGIIEEETVITPWRYVEFSKPYIFENEEYKGLDLSGLDDITGQQMIDIEQGYNKLGYYAVTQEMSMPYIFMVASEVSGKSHEFFKGLSAKECIKIKNVVSGFFYKK